MTVFDKQEQIRVLQAEVDRLRRERDLERIPVSEAMKEMCRFIGENERSDRLLNNIPTENPFTSGKPRIGCISFCAGN